MHWVSWEKMCRRKEEGGLGYRDLHLFKLAMLARQGRRMLQNPDSLCAQLLRAKYGTNGSLMQSSEGPGISYTWRSIVCGFQALQKGLIWRIGDGMQIKIWGRSMDIKWDHQEADYTLGSDSIDLGCRLAASGHGEMG